MIIVNLQGGLGNQLFQYAAGLSLKKQGKIYFDLSFLKKNSESNENFQARDFELPIFKRINYGIFNPLLLRICFSNNSKLKFFKKLLPFGLGKLKYINEDNIKNKHQEDVSLYLHGYFQNPRIFDNIRAKLISDLQFPILPEQFNHVKQEIQLKNSISLHIRRGDYLNQETMEYHGVLPISYYQKAVEKISKEVKDPHYFIFSDDVEWCNNELHFLSKKTIVSKLNTPNWIDMYLMSICDHHIIANSSFSWWGAWLNNKEHKLVIAPKKWFVNAKTEILPEEWIKL